MAEGRLAYHPTYFEVVTALAFLEFAERDVDVAVLEVGMGGRFDATNVVRPLVSVITTIAKDHETHLGSTLGKIAFEKAGIIKPAIPVVCGVKGGPALREIRRVAREREAPLTEVFGPGRTLETRRVRGGYRFVYAGENGRYAFSPGLAGRHQGENAAVAIAAAEVLSRVWRPLEKAKILTAVRETRWEGRLETVRRRPLVLLDGAHNVEGVTALVSHIKEVIRPPRRPRLRGHEGQRPPRHDPHPLPGRLDDRPDPRSLQALGDARRSSSPPPRPSRAASSSSPTPAAPSSLAPMGEPKGTCTSGTCPRFTAVPPLSSSPARSSSSAKSSGSGYSVMRMGTRTGGTCPRARLPVPLWGSPFRQLQFRGLRARVSFTFPPGKVA